MTKRSGYMVLSDVSNSLRVTSSSTDAKGHSDGWSQLNEDVLRLVVQMVPAAAPSCIIKLQQKQRVLL